ncbi:hypothetical protein JCM10295v2_001101 [Rhodotorula toruloides]
MAHRCPFPRCLRIFDKPRALGVHCARAHCGEAVPLEDHHPTLAERIFWDGYEASVREKTATAVATVDMGPREFDVETHPDAAWPCDEPGEFLPTHHAAPLDIENLLHAASDPLFPFDSSSQFRWTCIAVRMLEADTLDFLGNLEKDGVPRPFQSKKAAMQIVDKIPYDVESLSLDLINYGLVDLVGVVGYEYLTNESLPRGWCGVRIDLASYSTLCSTGTGGAAEHPVYMTIPCNAAYFRRGDYGANIVVLLWEPVRPLLEEGALLKYADGYFRWTRVYFGPQSLDYPEQCWMHRVVEGWCTTYEPTLNSRMA